MTVKSEDGLDQEQSIQRGNLNSKSRGDSPVKNFETALKGIVNQIGIADDRTNQEISEIREHLENVTQEAQSIILDDETGLDGDKKSLIADQVLDLNMRMKTAEGIRVEATEREDLDNRISDLVNFFEEETRLFETDDHADTQSTDFLSETVDYLSFDQFEQDYFEDDIQPPSEIEQLSTISEDSLLDEQLQTIAQLLERAMEEETPTDSFSPDDAELSEPPILQSEQSATTTESTSLSFNIENQIGEIAKRLEIAEKRFERIDSIESSLMRVFNLIEDSKINIIDQTQNSIDSLAADLKSDLKKTVNPQSIIQLANAFESFTVDQNYNDECTANTLRQVNKLLDQISEHFNLSEDSISELKEPVTTERPEAMGSSLQDRFQNSLSDRIEKQVTDTGSSAGSIQQGGFPQEKQTQELFAGLELSIDTDRSSGELRSARDIPSPVLPSRTSQDLGEQPISRSTQNSEPAAENTGYPANPVMPNENFIDAARRAAKLAENSIRQPSARSGQSGQSAAINLRKKLSANLTQPSIRPDDIEDFPADEAEMDIFPEVAPRPNISRMAMLTACVCFIAAGSTLFVDRIASKFGPGFMQQLPGMAPTDTLRSEERTAPSNGIAKDQPPQKLEPEIVENKRKFAGTDIITGSIARNNSIHQQSHRQATEVEVEDHPVIASGQGFTIMPSGSQNFGLKNESSASAKSSGAKIEPQQQKPIPVALKSDITNPNNANLELDSRRAAVIPNLKLPPASVGSFALRSAAATGNKVAQYEVGSSLSRNNSKTQDYKASSDWFARSASQGYAPAQYRLAALYERGLGVKKDLARARVWYRRAAEQGHIKAMHNLAVLYTGTNGTPPDYAQAAHWFEKAANYGLTDSQFNLAILYENGLGVRKNMTAAYKWVSLAAIQGDAEAQKRRQRLRGEISDETAAIAEANIKNWTAKSRDREANDVILPKNGWGKSLSQKSSPRPTASSDPKTQKVQSLLKKLGYDVGVVDGRFGKKTAQAIMSFQKRSSIPVTGLITGDLISKLESVAG